MRDWPVRTGHSSACMGGLRTATCSHGYSASMTGDAPAFSFEAPPVTEVALGVQFDPQSRLGGIQAADLWNAWRTEYPHLSEMPPLPSMPAPGQQSAPWIQVGGVPGVRLWFMNESRDHLIQLQPDRLVVNWRQQSEASYPRFPEVMGRFESAWEATRAFLKESGQELHLQQTEVTYINVIQASPAHALRGFDVLLGGGVPYAQVNANLARPVEHESWTTGVEETGIASGPSEVGESLVLSLSVKSVPRDRRDPLPSMRRAHEFIVESFSRITTDPMHELWRSAP